MTEPTRRPPDAPKSGDEFNLYRHGEYSRPNRTARFAMWLIALAVVIGLAAWGWHSGWGVRNPSTVAAAPEPAPTPTVNEPPILDVPTLLSSKPETGKEIVLRDVLVQSANGTTSLFVGPDKTQRVLIVPEDHAIPDTLQGKQRELKPEMIVTITGTVEKPSGSAKDMRHDWKLSSAEAKQVDDAGIYVKAERVMPQTY
jgi:hypothetical protein